MYRSFVRHRTLITKSFDVIAAEQLTSCNSCTSEEKPRTRHEKIALLSPVLWLLLFCVCGIILLYIHTTNATCPNPLTSTHSGNDNFIEERAKKHLDDLTSYGSRPVGSIANEEFTVRYLLNEIEEIRGTMASDVHNIEVDVQRVSGSFIRNVVRGQVTSCYENINNVIVRLNPKHSSNHSLLVNCHYDTSMNTTGASDDTVSCCVMLEVLRVMSRHATPYLHGVTFIFNGAEETMLQGSHGFITQHPWAKEIRAFLNLESCGAGGKQMLFQSGPEHPWLVSEYAKHAPHPFASIIAQEVFQSGLVPSDTDFRIYRDYGGLSGLDLAYITNGYVYHTAFDRPEMIPSGSIQQAGENVLAIVGGIANSPYLADPAEYRHGRIVFLDFLGHFMIIYPMRVGTVINTVVIFVVLGWIGSKMFHRGGGLHGVLYVKQLATAALVTLVSWLLVACAVAAIAFTLDRTGHAMSWYSSTSLVFGLYVAPAACVTLLTCSVAKKLMCKDAMVNAWHIEAVYFDVALIVNTGLLAAMTYHGLCSAILILVAVLFPTVFRLGALKLFKLSPTEQPRTFVTLHVIGQLVPSLLFLSFFYSCLVMFIPVMGRSGDTAFPDAVIGGLCALGVIALLIWHIGLVFTTRSMRWIILSLFGVFVISFFMATFTSIGFPYRANIANPTRQRLTVNHVERTFRDINGEVYYRDSGILVIPLDRNAGRQLSSYPLLSDAKPGDCRDVPYCGWPHYSPMITAVQTESMKYVPARRLDELIKPQLIMVNRTRLEPNIHQFTLSIEGPSRTNIYLSPRRGVQLTGWSVGDGNPQPTKMPPCAERPHYFIFYSYGTKPKQPFELRVDLRSDSSESYAEGLIDVALGGNYITVNGTTYLTPELDDFVDSLPDWTTTVAWPSTYDSWIF